MKRSPSYNIYKCNRCVNMEYSYFDGGISRWCKGYDCNLIFLDIDDLKERKNHCSKFAKAKKGKAKFVDKAKYLARYND